MIACFGALAVIVTTFALEYGSWIWQRRVVIEPLSGREFATDLIEQWSLIKDQLELTG